MKIVACYSNKGGVGKTATSVNLAHALARAGRRVLLCDLDPQGASGFYFRVKPSKKLGDDRFFTDVKRFTDAIRGSDFDGLDILPANMSFRDFDIFLSRMKNSRSRLKKALKAAQGDYDVVLLDCPPNISALSENVFRASDAVVVPVIPTTLSERTFEQLVDFFRDEKLPRKKIVAFFSMAQATKKLHAETAERLRKAHPKRFVDVTVPFSTEVEKMGVHRAPVATFAKSSPATEAYDALWRAVAERL
ncbi:ParA family protein [Roseivivax isoporae]|uniref:Cobyrinic acid a,c-diamide synthase n=1 Tax=Roseivivax isoporae LMG 25204 TaxID=1449351 RepID=X7FDI9_9RHOB|nr:AAA family ATPase [Roseivivax isoporae]ETX30131.1 cobyrinic acid a,c-diamide synthase [Roseivivax isoporae LMG 25204]